MLKIKGDVFVYLSPTHAVKKCRAILKCEMCLKTDPIRPVIDTSAKLTNYISLNQCSDYGPNQIEFIPDVLLRLR